MTAIPSALPVALVFVLGSLWGLHFSLIKICSESGFSHFSILTFTTLGVSLSFAVISLARKKLPPFSSRHIAFYFFCAVLGYVGPILIELSVARHMAAGMLTLIVSTTPIFTLIVALLLKTDTIGLRGLVGICTGGAAICTLLLPQILELDAGAAVELRWIALTFTVPIAYGIYHNYVAKAWPPGCDSWQVACGEMIVAILMLLPFYLAYSEPIFTSSTLQTAHWAMLAMVFFAVLEVFLYFEIVRLAGAVVVSLSNFVTIAAGVVWGMLIFSERPGLWEWVCVATLMFSLYLVLGSHNKSPSTQSD